MKVIWELNSGQSSSSHKILRLSQPSFSGPLHAHDAIELTWIVKGSGVRFVSHSVEPFQSGDLALIPPRVPHTWRSVAGEMTGVEAVVLQLDPSQVISLLPEWRSCMQRLGGLDRTAWVLQAQLKEDVSARLQDLTGESTLGSLGQILTIMHSIFEAVSHRRAEEVRPLQAHPLPLQLSNRSKRLDALLEWIQENYSKNIAVEMAARKLHISAGSFSRSFQRRVGRSFTQYVNDVRIANACLLLSETDKPISNVSEACGFNAFSNFSEQFRKRLGMTPRQYRYQSST